MSVRVAFVLGVREDKALQEQLLQEQQQHGYQQTALFHKFEDFENHRKIPLIC